MSYDLNELERLKTASNLDPLESTHIISKGFEWAANLTEEINDPKSKPHHRGRCIAMIPKEWADYIAAAVNAAPELIATIRTLQKEAEDIRGREAGLCYLIHGKEATIRRQESEITELRGMLADVLKSAYPHPVEHPTMFKMWNKIRERLEGK